MVLGVSENSENEPVPVISVLKDEENFSVSVTSGRIFRDILYGTLRLDFGTTFVFS